MRIVVSRALIAQRARALLAHTKLSIYGAYFFFLPQGEKKKIGTADRTPRETLEKRLEKTPSNARCFAQGSSLMC